MLECHILNVLVEISQTIFCVLHLAWYYHLVAFFVFLTDVFEKALNAGFIQATDYVEIWQAYLDYLRRRVDFSKGESCSVPEDRIDLCVWKFTGFTHFTLADVILNFSESSKELEELRGSFTRSLDYMKQDVEESRWILL